MTTDPQKKNDNGSSLPAMTQNNAGGVFFISQFSHNCKHCWGCFSPGNERSFPKTNNQISKPLKINYRLED